eukprot:scaffold187822_cov28-Tisochrysis_lutea.AAC.2
MHEANSVTKDFLLLSQPFINQGILITSASSGRRLYIHHLSEVPMKEVFQTRTGNHLQRVDLQTVKLAGTITLNVEDIPPLPVPSVQKMQSIPANLFAGSVQARDSTVLKLLEQGKLANTSGDFTAACACFEAAYALSVRAGMLVSAANMRLKLNQPATAAAMYKYVLAECQLLASESEMASRKLAEAQSLLKEKGIDGLPQAPSRGSRRQDDFGDSHFSSFASFGFQDGESDDGSDLGSPVGGGKGNTLGGFTSSSRNSNGNHSAFGNGLGNNNSVLGTFDADFGDFDDMDDGFLGEFGDTSHTTAHDTSKQIALQGLTSAVPSLYTGAKPPSSGVAGHGGVGDEFSDFGDFDEEPHAPRQKDGAVDGFGAFDSMPKSAVATSASALAPPSNPNSSVPRVPSIGAPDVSIGDSSGFGGASAAPLMQSRSHALGTETHSEYAALEERLRALESKLNAEPASHAELDHKLERLSAQVERRLTGVKNGMKGLHERLQAVEVAMAQLPNHFARFKERQRGQAKLCAEHTAALARLEEAIPALSAAAAACANRVGELTTFQDLLARSGDVLDCIPGANLANVDESANMPVAAELTNSAAAVPALAPTHMALNDRPESQATAMASSASTSSANSGGTRSPTLTNSATNDAAFPNTVAMDAPFDDFHDFDTAESLGSMPLVAAEALTTQSSHLAKDSASSSGRSGETLEQHAPTRSGLAEGTEVDPMLPIRSSDAAHLSVFVDDSFASFNEPLPISSGSNDSLPSIGKPSHTDLDFAAFADADTENNAAQKVIASSTELRGDGVVPSVHEFSGTATSPVSSLDQPLEDGLKVETFERTSADSSGDKEDRSGAGFFELQPDAPMASEDAFGSFANVSGLETAARDSALADVTRTITDDEFNALFGVAE